MRPENLHPELVHLATGWGMLGEPLFRYYFTLILARPVLTPADTISPYLSLPSISVFGAAVPLFSSLQGKNTWCFDGSHC